MFLWKGRLWRHDRIFCLFPDYLQTYHALTLELLVDKQTLPKPYRYYLALMAVSCYNCEYLRNLVEEQFVLIDGDPKWLDVGFKAVDKKLQIFASINEILAHRPWTMCSEVLDSLLRQSDRSLAWSYNEIVHASYILIHFHTLCYLVYGQGVTEEADQPFSPEFQESLELRKA